MDNINNLVTEFKPYCTNNEVHCKCRKCKKNLIKGGTCVHCFDCFQGDDAMNICKEYEE